MKRSSSLLGSLVLAVTAACGGADSSPPQAAERAEDALTGRSVVVLGAGARVRGKSIADWTERWWTWTFSVPAEKNPELVLEAPCAVRQRDNVFYVPAYEATVYQRFCTVPARAPVLVPLWVVVNDYPCPDPDFRPAPGQTLEAFLTDGVVAFNDGLKDLTVTIDGRMIDATAHRHTTELFTFTAHRTLVGRLPDACLRGTPQPGVSDGWWLMLASPPGRHAVHVTALAPTGSAIDYTYVLDAVD